MLSAFEITDKLRDAAARGRLVVVTGAGISRHLKRLGGKPLPSWGELVFELRQKADETRMSSEQREILDKLLPSGALDELHGDALIEASEILSVGFPSASAFADAIVDLCKEADGETSETHRAIAELAPAGVITFNYDQAHEQAFKDAGVRYERVIYNDAQKLKEVLADQGKEPRFLLKAHGCVTQPKSLVLTSSSYRNILSGNRVYRAFLQHILIHYTLLIVGFGMRDRDFDQLLSTLEIELGAPIHNHAYMVKRPDTTPSGLASLANWTAIARRFGISPLYMGKYSEFPNHIRSLGDQPGPFIGALIAGATSPRRDVRASVHDDVELLGPTGRRQMRAALLGALKTGTLASEARSELIYTLRGVADADQPAVAAALVDEIKRVAAEIAGGIKRGDVECVAHALLTLRRCRLADADRKAVIDALQSPDTAIALAAMDDWESSSGGVPRLSAYCAAACAELEARARS